MNDLINNDYTNDNNDKLQLKKINKILDDIEDIYNKEIEYNIYYLENENKELKKTNKILEEKLDNLTSAFCLLVKQNNYI